MSSTVVVRSTSGVLYEMDVPAAGHALDRWREKIDAGDLTIVTDPVEWVTRDDGSRHLVLAAPDPAPTVTAGAADVPQEPRKRGRPPKVTTAADSSADDEE